MRYDTPDNVMYTGGTPDCTHRFECILVESALKNCLTCVKTRPAGEGCIARQRRGNLKKEKWENEGKAVDVEGSRTREEEGTRKKWGQAKADQLDYVLTSERPLTKLFPVPGWNGLIRFMTSTFFQTYDHGYEQASHPRQSAGTYCIRL
jgi:hypothetical protein